MSGASGPVLLRNINILSVGEDQPLLRSRELLLASAGYRVLTIDQDSLIDRGSAAACQAALLCHTLREAHALRVAHLVLELNPQIQVLRISRFAGDWLPGVANAPPDPGDLLHALGQLVCAPDGNSGILSRETVRLSSARRERRAPFQFHSAGQRWAVGRFRR